MKLLKKRYAIFLFTILFLAATVKCSIGGILPFRRMSVYAYPIYRQYKSERIIKNLLKCDCSQEIVNQNIRVLWDKPEPRTIKVVIDNVENCLKRILEDLDCDIPDKIDIAVLCEDENIRIALDGYDIGFSMGAYFHGVILVLEPSTWMDYRMDFDEEFIKEGPLVHELAHYIVDYKTNGNKPTWFSEGIAILEEYQINGTAGKYGEELTDYYSLKEFQGNFSELEEIKAYTQSFYIVGFIADNFGMKSISDILTELGKGKTMEQSVKKVLGMNLQELLNKSLSI